MSQTRVLLTGISGLVGHHVMEHLLKTTDVEIVGLASFRHRGDPNRLSGETWERYKDRVTLEVCDLRAPIGPLTARRIGDVDVILNLASESHVDRSIEDPVGFGLNNVESTLTMLEFARHAQPQVFVQFSTDEVYGAVKDGLSKEWDPIIPSNPYSASKAAQEAFAISYWRTYGVPVVITNTMNVFGERQDPEKFIPKVIRALLFDEEVTIHGDKQGNAGTRFYIHARNAADALWHILTYTGADLFPDTDRPSRWHIVGEREVSNLELALMIADHMSRRLRYKVVDFHSSRPGHDLRYALDGSKLAAAGWTPPIDLETSLGKTIDWTLAHPEWLWT